MIVTVCPAASVPFQVTAPPLAAIAQPAGLTSATQVPATAVRPTGKMAVKVEARGTLLGFVTVAVTPTSPPGSRQMAGSPTWACNPGALNCGQPPKTSM